MKQDYYGTKRIKAEPMTWGDYCLSRNMPSPPGNSVDRAGYLVEYEDGYTSWSPEHAFKAYQPTDAMSFDHALYALKKRERVRRAGWNGKGMWLILVEPQDYEVEAYMMFDCFNQAPFIAMGTADKKFVPWLASQADLLAEDWMILE